MTQLKLGLAVLPARPGRNQHIRMIMRQPLKAVSQTPLDNGSPTQKTMFYTEGDPNAVLLTRSKGHYGQELVWFPHPVTALEWCLKNKVGFVFCYGTEL
jgi:hypothetical protein